MTKRIFSLMLALIMLVGYVPVHAHAADDCAHERVSSWQQTGNNQHRGWCSDCYQYVYRDCDTNGYYGNSQDGHYAACSVCGGYDMWNGTLVPHSGEWSHTSNWYGTQHQRTCVDCGYNQSGSCNYTYNVYESEGNQHWQVCTVCELPSAKTSCSGTTRYMENDQHGFSCNTCNQSVLTACDYSVWDQKSNSHQKKCSVCGHKTGTAENHDWAYEQGSYGVGYHKQYCKICGYVNTSNSRCSYTYNVYESEGNQHWQVCTVCGLAGQKTDCATLGNKYTYVDNDTHSLTCDTCKKGAVEACSYDTFSKTSTQHAEQCSACKHTKTAVDHTWAYRESSWGTGYHEKYCSACDYTPSSALENCDYDGQSYVTENGQHYRLCKKCNRPSSRTDCSKEYGVEYILNENDTHSFECKDCDQTVTVDCAYSGYETDNEGNHYQRCSVCRNTTAKEAHKDFVYDGYGFGTHKKTCGVCDATVASYEDCTYEGYQEKSQTDANYHYQECKFCKDEISTAHDFGDDLICDCGAEKHEHNWQLTADGTTITATCVCETGTCEYENNAGGMLTISVEGLTDGKTTYNGETREATITNNLDTGNYYDDQYTVTYYRENAQGEWEKLNYTKPVDAGTYKAEVYSYLDSAVKASVTFEIEKAELTVTATGFEGDYDGQEHGITVTAPSGVNVTYRGQDDTYDRSYSPTYSNAGEYTVSYTAKVSDPSKAKNYKNPEITGTATVKINKVDLDTAVEGYNNVYDGYAHGITVTVPSGVTVTYRGEGDTYDRNYSPTYTDVGTYPVSYKITVTGEKAKNYNQSEITGTADVVITPLDLATVLTVKNSSEFTYERNRSYDVDLGVNSSTMVPNTNYKYITVKYSTDNGENWTNYAPYYSDAGTYPVKYKIYVDGQENNIHPVEGTHTMTIAKAELPITALVGYQGSYDGHTHYGFGYKDENSYGFTVWYNYLYKELDYVFSWVDESGEARTLTVEAGQSVDPKSLPGFTKQNVTSVDPSKTDGANVTVKISSKNYNEKTFTYNVQIGPGWAESVNNEVTYDGSEHYIKNYISNLWYGYYGELYNPNKFQIKYRVEGTEEWLDAANEPGQTDVGSLVVEWKVTMDSDENGEWGEAPNSFGSEEVFTGRSTVKVVPAPLTVTANDKTITYGDVPSNAGVTYSGFVTGEDESKLHGGLTYSYNYEQYGNVGEYEITPVYTPAEDQIDNYTVTPVAGKLTVQKKEIVIDWTNAAPAKEGVAAVNPVATGMVNNDVIGLMVVWTLDEANDKWIANVEGITGDKAGNYKLPENTQKEFDLEKIFDVTTSTGAGYVVSGESNVKENQDYSFEVTIQDGYKKGDNFKVTVNDKKVELDNDGKCVVEDVQSDLHIVVSGVIKVHNVTASTGAGYTVKGEKTVDNGKDYTFEVTIQDGYKKGDSFKVTVNGNVIQPGVDGKYKVSNVTTDLKIEVSGVVKVHSVTASEGNGYKVDGKATVDNGADYTFKVDIKTGYKKGDNFKVTVNGIAITPDSDGTYTVKNVTSDLKIEVTGVVRMVMPWYYVENPFTGDVFNVFLWGGIMIGSLAGIVAAVWLFFKSDKQKGKFLK